MRTLTYLLMLFFLSACRKENALDCFKSNGKDLTELRYPGGFNTIEAYDKMDVTIIQGPEFRVELTAGKNILDNISTSVRDSVLRLENNNKCNFVRGYKRKITVRVIVPGIAQVFNYGVGPIVFADNFSQEKIFVKAENSGDTYINGTFGEVRTSSHGNGDMYLKGTVKRLMVYSYGTNYTRAEDLKVSDYVFVSTRSLGDTYLNLEGLDILDYQIYDAGNIYYKGKAKTIRDMGETQAPGKAISQD